eukprot:9883838-Lingulodinium_polyedra.AAC.1
MRNRLNRSFGHTERPRKLGVAPRVKELESSEGSTRGTLAKAGEKERASSLPPPMLGTKAAAASPAARGGRTPRT